MPGEAWPALRPTSASRIGRAWPIDYTQVHWTPYRCQQRFFRPEEASACLTNQGVDCVSNAVWLAYCGGGASLICMMVMDAEGRLAVRGCWRLFVCLLVWSCWRHQARLVPCLCFSVCSQKEIEVGERD